ncbi:MAG: glycosyltransferase family 2 protein [Clostridiales bacterium]|nr:glycosyltransferase family 2 protein [Clostridiales bacterium]
MTVDVLIPTYRPGRRFLRLLQMLERQTVKPERIIVMNTEKAYWNDERYRKVRGLEVRHVTKLAFDHGGTRNLAAWYSEADVMLFMTDDAVPQDEYLIERLLEGLSQTGAGGETVAMAYARQLPAKGCRVIERFTRSFNYPEEPMVKTAADLPRLGIKTYFASNVCCAYRKDIFDQLEGFTAETIFNEDMIYAAGAIAAGYAIAYVPEARVIHSHNLSPMQQFRRNFDMAVSQADHPEVFEGVPSEGEGIRLVKQTMWYLLRTFRPWLIPSLILTSGMKYLGYRMGKRYRRLPRRVIRWCSMSPLYWEKRWEAEAK